MKRTFLIMLILSYLLSACHNTDRKNEGTPVYVSYQVSGEEGQENVNCLFQFKRTATSARTVEPYKVTFDNEVLKADSAPLTGAYYEVRKPLANFNGAHTIVFTDSSEKQYAEIFEYKPFQLVTALPEVIARKDMTLQLAGLDDGDTVRVVIIDTSFNTNGINELKAVMHDKIQITRDQLNKIASGPITLQLIKEEERPVKNPPENGGIISISYGLTRDLELRD